MDNFDLKKYIAEGKLLKDMKVSEGEPEEYLKSKDKESFDDAFDRIDKSKEVYEKAPIKENTINNKYVVKDEEDSDDEYDFYFIDKQKALDYLSQFNNEEIDAEQFIDDDAGWGEFISSLVDVEQMTDKELEDAMRQEMSFYYYSDGDSI